MTPLLIFADHPAIHRSMPTVIAAAKGVMSVALLQRSVFHKVHVPNGCEGYVADHVFLIWTTSGPLSEDGAQDIK